MAKRGISLLLVLMLVMSIVAVGCGKNEVPQSTNENVAKEPEKPSEPQYGGVMKIALENNVKNLDPLYIDSTTAEQVMCQVGETLIETNSDCSEYLPCLATSWEISEDGLEYKFKIRENVYFHEGKYQNGRLMTPEDVAYSINRSKGYFCNYLWMLDRMEVTGEDEVTAYLTQRDATFLYQLSHSSTSIVPKEEVEGWGKDFTTHLVSTGPFVLKEHLTDQKSVLVRNEKYWGEKPYLDGIEFVIIPDQAQAINALRTGEIDLVFNVMGESTKLVKGDSNLTLMQSPAFRVRDVGFNMEDEILDDIRVRKALLMGTDYQQLAAGTYLYGEGIAACLPLPKKSWAYDEAFENLIPKFSPEEGKKLLAEAGYPNGFKVEVMCKGDAMSMRSLTILQQQWKQNLNVDLQINTVEATTYMDSLIKGTVQMWSGAQTSTSDPATSIGYQFNTAKLHSNYNAWCYSNPEVDKLITKGVEELDREKRIEIYKEIMEKTTPECVGIFFGNDNVSWGVSNKLHGVVQENKSVITISGNGINIWKEK